MREAGVFLLRVHIGGTGRRADDEPTSWTLGTGESMEHNVSICDCCGVALATGDWPFCPHGRSASVVISDDVPGGFWVENGFAEPRMFYSKSAHRQALAAENMEVRAKWAGPEDKYLTRWDAVDLDSAAALVRRNSEAVRARNREKLAPITVTDGEAFREKDLDVGPVQTPRE